MKESKRLALLKQQTANDNGLDEERVKFAERNVIPSKSGSFSRRLLQAGIEMRPLVYSCASCFLALIPALILLWFGKIISILTFVALVRYFHVEYLEERAVKRKLKMVPQLAAFIDGLTGGLSTGFNIEAAFFHATQGVPPGLLRQELERVVNALSNGFSLKEAMLILRERFGGQEVLALMVSLNLFASMGGHVLEPFRRLAQKIREQEVVLSRASRDLVMVKQAFYLLLILSIGVPGILMLVEPNYMMTGLQHPVGRLVFQVGLLMVLAALVGFKKLTSIRI